MKNWALYHTHSGYIEYFKTEEEAENERILYYNEWLQTVTDEEDDNPSFDKCCEFWKIEQVQDK